MTTLPPVAVQALTMSPAQAVALGVELSRLLEATGYHPRTANPRFIRVTHDGAVRLIDEDARPNLHGPGAVERLSWFSPELVRGYEPSAISDVFLVGLAIVGALTHRSPYLRESPYDTLRAVMEGQWGEPLRATRPDVPGPLVDVLVRALIPRPEQRTASLAALRRHLGPFASPHGADFDWRALVSLAFAGQPPRAQPPAHLADEHSRLVAADQLEESGRHDEAQWVRLECHVRQADASAREPLRQALEAASSQLGKPAIAPPARGPVERCPLVCGGRCPGAWERLLLTDTPHLRRCGECGADVHFELSVQTAWQRVIDGQAVVVDVAASRVDGDLTPADMDQLT